MIVFMIEFFKQYVCVEIEVDLGKDKGMKGQNSTKGDWSSGMIPVLGTGGPGFNSRIAPFLSLYRLPCQSDSKISTLFKIQL